jgi:uncharacterized membrane protein YphA (DoxX/SURF4 family)
MLTTTQKRLSLGLQILSAVIMAQTLYFKFSGAPEPVYIFSKLGAEPWGRWFDGVPELVAAVLLLWPGMAGIGAVFSLGIMSGAILAHLTKLGIVVLDDGGLLFNLALVVQVSCIIIAWMHRQSLVGLVTRLKGLVSKA